MEWSDFFKMIATIGLLLHFGIKSGREWRNKEIGKI